MKNFSRRRSTACRTGIHSWEQLDSLDTMTRYRCRECKHWMVENTAYPEDPFRIYEPHEIAL